MPHPTSAPPARTPAQHDTRLPPPLARRRRPAALAWRAALWRWRFLVAAVCLAVATAAALDSLRPPPAVTVPVVVAAHDVPAGTSLTAADVEVRHLPAALAPAGTHARAADVVGTSTAVPVLAGLPLVAGVLATDDVRGPPGTVVTAVRLADPAVAALLVPGTRVDVLAATPEGTVDGTVATRALVLPVPVPASTPTSPGLLGGASQVDAPPVLLAVSPAEAAALAGASASALLSAVLVP